MMLGNRIERDHAAVSAASKECYRQHRISSRTINAVGLQRPLHKSGKRWEL
jgi:hypothetical protein